MIVSWIPCLKASIVFFFLWHGTREFPRKNWLLFEEVVSSQTHDFLITGKSANWIRNFGIRIGSEGRGVWALIWKQVGLSAGLAELLGEAGPVSQAPVDRHCFAGPGNRCLVQTSIND